MPDGDKFPGLHRSWWAVGRAVHGKQDPAMVGSCIEKALARHLRSDPSLPALARAAATVARSGDPSSVRDVVSREDLQRSPFLRRLGAASSCGPSSDGCELVEQTLTRVAQVQLETLRPVLLRDDVFPTAASAGGYLRDCLAGVDVDSLARQIVDGSPTIRAPRRARRGTAEMLHEPLA